MIKKALLIAFLVVLAACLPGKDSFRVAQICLTSKETALQLVQVMKQIANEEQMAFVDGSAETARGLKIIGYDDRGRTDGSLTIHLGVHRADGMGVTIGNMGLPGYKMAIGFSEGSNPSEGNRFANKVIDRLGRLGPLEELPAGSRIQPDPKCGDPQRPSNP